MEKENAQCEAIRANFPFDFLQILDLFKILRKHYPDIIHTHGYKSTILGFFLAKLFKIHVIRTFHGWLPINNFKSKFYALTSLIVLKYFDRVIAVSDQIRQGLEKKNIPSNKLLLLRNVPTINNGSRVEYNKNELRDEIGIPHHSKLIGFIGRLEPIKGCSQLISSIPYIIDCHSNFYFIIVGDGSQREVLAQKVIDLQLEGRVYFYGYHSNVTKVFRSLDLFVLPSLNEGIPLALLESMSNGVLAIATNVGGVPEVIEDRINGILVPPNNPRALSKAILHSFKNEEEKNRMIYQAQNTVKIKFNVEKWIKTTEDIYNELLTSRKR